MVDLIIVPLYCNIPVKMSKQCKYKLGKKLWGATIAPQNHLMQFAHQFFQLVDDVDNAAKCSDSRVIIWFADNGHRNFSQIVLATVAVIRASCKYAKALLTTICRLYLILLRVTVAFTIVNVNKCLYWLQIQLLLIIGYHLLSLSVDMLVEFHFLNSLIKRKTLVDFRNFCLPLSIQKCYCFHSSPKSDNDKFDVKQSSHSPTMQTSWLKSQTFAST